MLLRTTLFSRCRAGSHARLVAGAIAALSGSLLLLAPLRAQEAARIPPRTAATRSDEARPDRAFAPAMEQSRERGVEVETDLVAMRAELEYDRAMDAVSEEAVRAARLEQARREAPYDLAWGFED